MIDRILAWAKRYRRQRIGTKLTPEYEARRIRELRKARAMFEAGA